MGETQAVGCEKQQQNRKDNVKNRTGLNRKHQCARPARKRTFVMHLSQLFVHARAVRSWEGVCGVVSLSLTVGLHQKVGKPLDPENPEPRMLPKSCS